jgi:hypothetical protein
MNPAGVPPRKREEAKQEILSEYKCLVANDDHFQLLAVSYVLKSLGV